MIHLNTVVRQNAKLTANAKVVQGLTRCAYSREAFVFFAIQRAKLSVNFQSILRSAIAKALDAKRNENGSTRAKALADVLQRNLDDELGMDASGRIHPEQAHIRWRDDYLARLGVSEAVFTSEVPLAETRSHCQGLIDLEQHASLLFMAGALLLMERIIPLEYTAVGKSRDLLFPELFVHRASDTAEERSIKDRARLYIDDHAEHDMKSHFPKLLVALKGYARGDQELSEIQEGMEYVAKLRAAFYEAVEARMLY